MSQIILLVGIPLIVIAGVILAVMTSTRDACARRRFLEEYDFRPCQAERSDLEARVRALLGDLGIHVQVLRPCRRHLPGRTVHFFTLHQYRTSQDARAARVFLLPLARRTHQPCTLFLKPSALPEGWLTRGLRALIKLRSGACPGGSAPLDLPHDPEAENLLGAQGPAGTSIRELIDGDLLRQLLQAGSVGFLTVHCRGNDCLLEHPAGLSWDLDQAWAFITRLDRLAPPHQDSSLNPYLDPGLPAAS